MVSTLFFLLDFVCNFKLIIFSCKESSYKRLMPQIRNSGQEIREEYFSISICLLSPMHCDLDLEFHLSQESMLVFMFCFWIFGFLRKDTTSIIIFI